MTTPAQHDTRVPAATPRLATLRGNCMGAAVLLIVQFALGMGLNLYVSLPSGKSFFATVFSSAVLAGHAIVALALLGAAIGALVRAIRVGVQPPGQSLTPWARSSSSIQSSAMVMP